MNDKTYQFEAEIKKVSGIDGAYIEFPYDIRKDGSVCYIIGILKDIRKKINTFVAMNNRDFRIQKAQETLQIIGQGNYRIDNVEIDIMPAANGCKIIRFRLQRRLRMVVTKRVKFSI